MLVEIFEGVFVRADQVNEIQAREEEEEDKLKAGGEERFVVQIWLYDHQPEHSIASRTSVFETFEEAQQAARKIKERVNMALERGRR